MTSVILLCYVPVLVLCILFYIRIWKMTAHVKEIRDFLLSSANETQQIDRQPHQKQSVLINIQSGHSVDNTSKGSSVHLAKGNIVEIQGFGKCTYFGLYNNKHSFYPQVTSNLPNSPYLVQDAEPYLLIPEDKLKEYIL